MQHNDEIPATEVSQADETPSLSPAEGDAAGAPASVSEPASTEAAEPEADVASEYSDAALSADAQAMVDALSAAPAEMPGWLHRLLLELQELEERLGKLGEFLKAPKDIHPTDLQLLYEQRLHMGRLVEVLRVRARRAVNR